MHENAGKRYRESVLLYETYLPNFSYSSYCYGQAHIKTIPHTFLANVHVLGGMVSSKPECSR